MKAAVYDGYNLERTSAFIQNFSIENVSSPFSAGNELNYSISDATEKYMRYMYRATSRQILRKHNIT